MKRGHVVIILQRLMLLQSANLLTYPSACSEDQGNCILRFNWKEWTPHIYNVSIESSNISADTSLALSLSNSFSFNRIILCYNRADRVSPVKVFENWSAKTEYDNRALFLGRVHRFSDHFTCSFSIFKRELPTTHLQVTISTVNVLEQNSSVFLPVKVFELGLDIEFRENDRYFIRSSNFNTQFVLCHGICMLIAYATVFTLSIFLSRYLKRISYGQRCRKCYVALLLLSITIQGIGLFCLLGLHDKLDMTPIKFHRTSGILVTILLGFHLIFILLKPYLEDSRLKKHVSHMSMILSMSIFLLSFSCCFTGLAQLTGLPRGTLIYIACYMFLIIVVGFVFSELLYIYYPVKIEGYFKTLKVSFAVISLFICLFGLSVPIILFVL